MYLKKKCEQCELEKSCQAIHLEVSFSLDTDSFLHFKVWCPDVASLETLYVTMALISLVGVMS